MVMGAVALADKRGVNRVRIEGSLLERMEIGAFDDMVDDMGKGIASERSLAAERCRSAVSTPTLAAKECLNHLHEITNSSFFGCNARVILEPARFGPERTVPRTLYSRSTIDSLFLS